MAVHRDTVHEDGRVKLHVHVARSAIDPRTLRTYNHQRSNTRMDRAARAIELKMGMFHDRGLAVVDQTPDGSKFVRDWTVPERLAWRREKREERLIALERSRYADNALREGSFERYAEARIEPRFREVLLRAKEVGHCVHAVEITNTAARLGTVIQLAADGELQLRDLSTARLREKQREEIEELKAASADAKSLEREEKIDALKAMHKGELAAEIRRLHVEGEVVALTPTMAKQLRGALRDPRVLADVIAIERAFIAAVDKDPALVARTLTQTTSTFGRDDVDRYVVDQICDVGEIERLADGIFAEDPSLVLLSPDVADGVWTTREMQDTEQQVASDARALAQQPGRIFSTERRAAAMAAMKSERSSPDEPFALSDEQKMALSVVIGRAVRLSDRGELQTPSGLRFLALFFQRLNRFDQGRFGSVRDFQRPQIPFQRA